MQKFSKLIECKLETSKAEALEFIQKIIILMFTSIEQTNTSDESNLIFDILGDIQFILAREIFGKGLEVNEFLETFVKDFDRIDDDFMKNYLYDKIKGKNYL